MTTSVALRTVRWAQDRNGDSVVQPSSSPRMAVKEKIIVAAFICAFTIVYALAAFPVVGDASVIRASAGWTAETAYTYPAD